jgi:uncharacterized protein (DUF2141 family)
MRHFITTLFTVFLFSFAAFAQKASITVRIPNLSNNTGKAFFALYKEGQNWLTKQPYRDGIVAIKGNYVEITWANLEAGHYAVSFFHDENNNKEFDTNFMGLPTEGFGFTNKTSMVYSKPAFKDCQFSVNQAEQKVINMRAIYFL